MDKPNDKPKSQFVADFAAAQAKMKHAAFDSTNPHFRSRYASLASVLDATVAALARVGIIVKQRSVIIDGNIWVKTYLVHPSGEQDEPSYWPIAPGTQQQMGSNLTYGRRYQISMVCNIASEEDDDGNAASEGPKKSAYAARKEGWYPIAEKAIRETLTLGELNDWWKAHQAEMRELPPHWLELLHEEKDRRKLQLIDEVEEDTELKKQLKGSLVE